MSYEKINGIQGKKRLEILEALGCHEYQTAINLAKEYLNEYKDDVYVLLLLGFTYKTAKMYDDALNIYDYVLSIEQNNIVARLDLFDLYYELQQYDVAKPILDEILTSPTYKVVFESNKANFLLLTPNF